MRLRTGFLKNLRGATTVEYGLMLAIGVLAVLAAITALGDELLLRFSAVQGEMNGAAAPAADH